MVVHGIALYLAVQGIVTYTPDGSGGDCFVDYLPGDPDEAVAIFSTPGRPPDVKFAYDLPSFQLVVRGAENGDPRVPYERAQRAYDALHGFGDRKLPDGTYVVLIRAVGSLPETMGRDGNGRHRYGLKFDAEVANDTALHRFE